MKVFSSITADQIKLSDSSSEGVRALKRFLQSRVESLAAKLIISDDPEPGATLAIDFDGKELTGKFV